MTLDGRLDILPPQRSTCGGLLGCGAMGQAKTAPAAGTDLAAACERALVRCRVLNRQQAGHFLDHGYVVVPQAFPPAFAAAARSQAWAELRTRHGVSPNDRATWPGAGAGRGVPGYYRTASSGRRLLLQAEAPRAFAAVVDVVGGAERLPENGAELALSDAAVANLGGPDARWAPPSIRQRGWHKDGWHFRHFLDSPEQGLLLVPFFSDVLPRSGGTAMATDSIAPVARLLAAHPEGLHADGVQGGGYLIPGLVEQCRQFAELTGAAGDLAIIHPYMLHRACSNPSGRPRFIANVALVLRAPMRFRRRADDYSLVELATLRALGVESLSFAPAKPRERLVPAPFRNDAERARERSRLAAERTALAAAGTAMPDWGTEFGYGAGDSAG